MRIENTTKKLHLRQAFTVLKHVPVFLFLPSLAVDENFAEFSGKMRDWCILYIRATALIFPEISVDK